MRGQLMPAEQTVLMGLMSTKNEVPPVPVTGSGVASVSCSGRRDASGNVAAAAALFNLDYTGFDAPRTSSPASISTIGAAGINGPVVINTGSARRALGARSIPPAPAI